MDILFLICVTGAIATVPLHFVSVEHLKLQERYGKERGTRIGEICGLLSGWGFFFFWIGIWVSPQSTFTIPVLQNVSVVVPVVGSSIPMLHLILCALFLVPGAWLAIKGVNRTTLRVAETHRTERVATEGVYSIVRHPQYLGGLLSHAGISFLLSAWYSLLVTPLMIALIYFIARKEEQELLREFGKEYEDYRKDVPMLLPRVRRK